MRYLFTQCHGSSTTLVIVEDPKVVDGTLYATKIGQFSGWNDEEEEVYKACSPVRFIAGGGPWTLEEYTSQLK